MKKSSFIILSYLVLSFFNCSDETLDLNEFDLIPKKLSSSYLTSTRNDHFNSFGNHILRDREEMSFPSFPTQVLEYNSDRQITLFQTGIGTIDEASAMSFHYDDFGVLNKIENGSLLGCGRIITINNRSGNKINGQMEVICVTGTNISEFEFTFKTEEHKIIEKLNFLYGSTSFEVYDFYYDDQNRPILIEYYTYNTDTSSLELYQKVEQTFDDRHNFFKNQKQQDILTHIFLKGQFVVDQIDQTDDLKFIMNKFTPSNLLTQTVTHYQYGYSLQLSFEYEYNDYGYPISGIRTLNDYIRTYTFEYY